MSIDLTAGLRYYEEKLSGFETNSGTLTPDAGRTYRSWNPRVSVAWHPTMNSTIYASATKGFRGGQFQPTSSLALAGPLGIVLPVALDQDSIWSYELGAKAELLDRVVAELALFYSDWKDVTVHPVEQLSLTANATYVDAGYSTPVAGTGIVKGGDVEDVARFTAFAAADYRAEIRDGLTGFPRASWQNEVNDRLWSASAGLR